MISAHDSMVDSSLGGHTSGQGSRLRVMHWGTSFTSGLTLSGTFGAKHAPIPIAAPMRHKDGVALLPRGISKPPRALPLVDGMRGCRAAHSKGGTVYDARYGCLVHYVGRRHGCRPAGWLVARAVGDGERRAWRTHVVGERAPMTRRLRVLGVLALALTLLASLAPPLVHRVSRPVAQPVRHVSRHTALALPADGPYLHTDGGLLRDAQGHAVRLSGGDWFGLETCAFAPDGLGVRSWWALLDQVRP